jgi:hypothetical protein
MFLRRNEGAALRIMAKFSGSKSPVVVSNPIGKQTQAASGGASANIHFGHFVDLSLCFDVDPGANHSIGTSER